jgi:mannitol-1-phosphate/altronate dehydrogenase
MTDYGTIKIPREEYERHNDRREDMDLTWAAYIDGEAPDTVDADDLAGQITDQIGEEITVTHDDINTTDDAEAFAAKLAERFDYAHLADRVSEQVVREMGGR